MDNENANDHYDNYYNNHNIQVDYSGNDVTLEIFLALLGRHEPHTPLNKKPPMYFGTGNCTGRPTGTSSSSSSSKTNLLIYITGHGGDNLF